MNSYPENTKKTVIITLSLCYLLLPFLFMPSRAVAAGETHWPYNVTSKWTPVYGSVLDTGLREGDTVAVFDEEGNCCGAGLVRGGHFFLSAFMREEADAMNENDFEILGFDIGDTVRFKAFREETGEEIELSPASGNPYTFHLQNKYPPERVDLVRKDPDNYDDYDYADDYDDYEASSQEYSSGDSYDASASAGTGNAGISGYNEEALGWLSERKAAEKTMDVATEASGASKKESTLPEEPAANNRSGKEQSGSREYSRRTVRSDPHRGGKRYGAKKLDDLRNMNDGVSKRKSYEHAERERVKYSSLSDGDSSGAVTKEKEGKKQKELIGKMDTSNDRPDISGKKDSESRKRSPFVYGIVAAVILCVAIFFGRKKIGLVRRTKE